MTVAVPSATRARLALAALLALVVAVLPLARAAVAGPTAPVYTLAVSSPQTTEGNAGQKTMTFTLSLTPPAVEQVVVDYRTALPEWTADTVDIVAAAPGDFQTAAGSVTFTAGQSSRPVSVVILGDTAPEPNEAFGLEASVDGQEAVARGTGTIVNDDGAAPSIQIADAAVTEGNTGTTTLAFTVTRTGNTSHAVDFDWRTTDDGSGADPAGSGDYAAVTEHRATIPAGVTTGVVNVSVNGDTVVEMNETFLVQIKRAYNASVGDAEAVGTINDDDKPAVTFADTLEGDDPNTGLMNEVNPNLETEGQRTFTVQFADTAAPSGRTVTVDYATTDDSAGAPGDYTTTVGTLTFAPGETSQDFSVPIKEDTLPEGTEDFKVTLSNPTNATLGTDTVARGRIVDDDGTDPSVDISSPTVNEPDTGSTTTASFDVSLSLVSGEVVTVTYATAPGTATAPADYTHTTGTLTFQPGETKKTVAVPVNGDTAAEGNETFDLTVTGTTNANQACSGCGTATIVDNETVTVSITDAATTEGDLPLGNGPIPFTVTLSTAIAQDVVVEYHTVDGTAKAPSDYTAKATDSEVTITAGNTSAQIEIDVTADDFGEPLESFTVVLESSDVATIADGTAVGELADDDANAPTVSVADVIAAEDGTFEFDVTVSSDPVTNPDGISVDYTLTAGTATADDFAPETGTATFSAGPAAPYTITVDVTDDNLDEASETLTVTLSNPSNAEINDGEATGTITDDDGPEVTITDETVTEGDSGTKDMVFTVALTAPSAEPFDVDYAFDPGDTEAGDITVADGTLTFAAGDGADKTITAVIVGDTDDEPNEAFTVALTLPDESKATLGKDEGTGTITDDDGPTISIDDPAAVAESPTGTVNEVEFTVTLSAASEQPVDVDYTTVAASATEADYVAESGTLTIPAEAATGTIDIAIKADTLDEADEETFKVVLSNPVNATVADGEGTGRITDDDNAPTMSIGDQSVTEGNHTAVPVTLQVTMSRASGKTVTATYSTSNGSATAPGDYTAKSGTLTFNPGETSKQVTVMVAGDTAVEGTEDFFVDLLTVTNATTTRNKGKATVVDNDVAEEPTQGYWLTGEDAGVFSFGEAQFHGSMGGEPINESVIDMAATPSGNGYWQVATDGGIFSFGDAPFLGSMGGTPLNEPVVGMASTPSGKGYWLVASDGGIFSFGDATFLGSMGGTPLVAPVFGMDATPDGRGYWMVAADGGVFTFGNAGFHGSAAGFGDEWPIMDMAATPSGAGYWLVRADGAVFARGDAQALDSMAGKPLNGAIMSIAAWRG